MKLVDDDDDDRRYSISNDVTNSIVSNDRKAKDESDRQTHLQLAELLRRAVLTPPEVSGHFARTRLPSYISGGGLPGGECPSPTLWKCS